MLKLPIEVQIKLNQFKPREYQEGIINALERDNFKKIFTIWPRRCLSGESHILMGKGSFKLLKDIIAGDSILSWDGKEFVPDVVINHWKTGLQRHG